MVYIYKAYIHRTFAFKITKEVQYDWTANMGHDQCYIFIPHRGVGSHLCRAVKHHAVHNTVYSNIHVWV